jgi:hypothetical protein
MIVMDPPTIDQRVAALELQVARISQFLPGQNQPPQKDWRSTLGMFANDPIMKEIIEEGRKIRQLDREQNCE